MFIKHVFVKYVFETREYKIKNNVFSNNDNE